MNKNKKTAFKKRFLWFLQESNQGHTDFQSVALPTELRNLVDFSGAKIESYLIQTKYKCIKFSKKTTKIVNHLKIKTKNFD